MEPQRELIWQGVNNEGVTCCIARDHQWERHVAKRPEIADALELTVRAMVAPETVEPDKKHPVDEPRRKFRVLFVKAEGKRKGYRLRVSVKYVRQPSGEWVKFYQSCWFVRAP